jgi:hypothetical protein
MLSARGQLDLIVHDDAFEVSHPFPPARFLSGQECGALARPALQAGPPTLGVGKRCWCDCLRAW